MVESVSDRSAHIILNSDIYGYSKIRQFKLNNKKFGSLQIKHSNLLPFCMHKYSFLFISKHDIIFPVCTTISTQRTFSQCTRHQSSSISFCVQTLYFQLFIGICLWMSIRDSLVLSFLIVTKLVDFIM